MTITKKEKILIFVLLLFLLVGGIYTLGIMPKNNDKKAAQEKAAAITNSSNTGTLDVVKDKITKIDANARKKMQALIDANLAALELLSDPENNVNDELQSGSQIGQDDSTSVSIYINNYFAAEGISTAGIKINAPTITSGKKVYKFTTSFSAENFSVLSDFVDKVAWNVSYNISSLTYTIDETGKVSGTMGFTITYLP